ncbi:GNAT family N-acetyltransferase, partial [Thermodesulfobacteriota bacterium]
PESDDVAERIGANIARLINDGACIHTGFDTIPQAILRNLTEKNDLGVHTEIFSDSLVPLIERGNVTNRRKKIDTNRCVASLCLGTERLFRFVEENPVFEFQTTDYTNNPYIIGRNDRVTAIIGASRMDLTGQVAYSGATGGAVGGFGGDFDFIKGSSVSQDGKAIIALRSTVNNGTESSIVSNLGQAVGVVASRADVHYVVTEFGIANLYGKCIRDRVMSLISIAHPGFREQLIEEAKELGYIYKDQVFIKESGYLYPYDLETTRKFKEKVEVLFRPIKPSDEPLMKELFYDLPPEAVYTRYFNQLKAMPHRRLQQYVNIDYETTMALVGTVGDLEHERVIAEGRYTGDPSTDLAEVAFTVLDDYQNLGIASFLLEYLAAIAKERGIRGFTAYVMHQNQPMIKVFRRLFPKMKVAMEEAGVYHVTMFFDAEGKEDARKNGAKAA